MQAANPIEETLCQGYLAMLLHGNRLGYGRVAGDLLEVGIAVRAIYLDLLQTA